MCGRASLEPRHGVIVFDSVFVRPHEYDESLFSKISTLESVFENFRYLELENAGFVWTVAVFGEKSLRFRRYPATCRRDPMLWNCN